jgi:hypothetical protein
MNYIILTEDLSPDLETKVKEYFELGFKLTGGVSFNTTLGYYMQAMYK